MEDDTLEIPKIDVKEAGVEWLDDPLACRSASAHMWQDALAVLTSHLVRLAPVAHEAYRLERQKDMRFIQNERVRIEKLLSGVQTMLRSLHE